MQHDFNPLFVMGEKVFNSDMVQIGTIPSKQVKLRLISSEGETITQVQVPASYLVSDLGPLKAAGVAKLEVVA